jgi:hypothetical protein
MVKTIHLTSLAVSLLATRVLSVALLYSGHCSLFTTLSTGTYNTSIFSGTGVQATVPNVYYGWKLVPVYLSHLLLVVCLSTNLGHDYFFNRMSTTYCTVVLLYYHYLCCCVASCYKYCFLFLFGALCCWKRCQTPGVAQMKALVVHPAAAAAVPIAVHCQKN